MTTTRDPLAVLHLALQSIEFDYGVRGGAELKEAIAQVEALVESHVKLLDTILAEAEARSYDPPADTTLVADAMTVQATFTPGQDSEGGAHERLTTQHPEGGDGR